MNWIEDFDDAEQAEDFAVFAYLMEERQWKQNQYEVNWNGAINCAGSFIIFDEGELQ